MEGILFKSRRELVLDIDLGAAQFDESEVGNAVLEDDRVHIFDIDLNDAAEVCAFREHGQVLEAEHSLDDLMVVAIGAIDVYLGVLFCPKDSLLRAKVALATEIDLAINTSDLNLVGKVVHVPDDLLQVN